MTAAKIGRSMKNGASFMIASLSALSRFALRRDGCALARFAFRFVHRDQNRSDLHSRTDALQTVDDDAIAWRQPRSRDSEPVDDRSECDAAVLNRLVRRDDEYEALVQVGANGAVLNQQSSERALAGQLQTNEQPRHQAVIRVAEDGAAADRAG